MKILKKIEGEPICVGDRTLIPIVELTTFSAKFNISKDSNDLLIGFMLIPISIRIIQDGKELILTINENEKVSTFSE